MASKSRDTLRLLLLQIRNNPHVRAEELESFARHAKLRPNQIDVFNVFDQPEVPVNAAQGYDALIVGGASEANVLEPNQYPFVVPAQRLMRRCLADGVPVFASCFGFQLAVLALGGEVIHDETDFEVGTSSICLAPAAQHDPLMHDTPNGFYGVSVHHERALQAPPDTASLAFTDACCHAFRVPGKPFWAFQFHPELDRPTLMERLGRFKDQYTTNQNQLEHVINSLQETPESNALLEKFVDRILLSGEIRA